MVKTSIQSRKNILKIELQRAEYNLLSFPRSGRTWTRGFLGHYCVRAINNQFNHLFTTDKIQPNRPTIAIRHDYMSFSSKVSDKDFKKLTERKKFLFDDIMHSKKMIYLIRNPIDVMISWFYYENEHRKNTSFENLLDCCNDSVYGLDHLIKFHNMLLDHHDAHTHEKIIIQYEKLKQGNTEWKKLLHFLNLKTNEQWINECHAETSFQKMHQQDTKEGNSKFYRQGGSNYIENLSANEKNILENWPGMAALQGRISNG